MAWLLPAKAAYENVLLNGCAEEPSRDQTEKLMIVDNENVRQKISKD